MRPSTHTSWPVDGFSFHMADSERTSFEGASVRDTELIFRSQPDATAAELMVPS